MSIRRASCSCGQLHLDCTGEPVRVSVCHCLACQQRTGSAFGAQARFHRSQISGREGRATEYVRVGDSGGHAAFYFCPVCGSTVYYETRGKEAPFTDDFVAIPVGAFADPQFPAPQVSVYEARKHPWMALLEGDGVVHSD
jgi:hypothetical protein